jgi:cardiolipin synthase
MSPRPSWATVPNGLSIVRILLTPFFAYCWWRHFYGPALAVFTAACLSDILDGLIARVFDQRSRVGQVLDPAADKLLVLVTFLTAAATGAVPRWLAALVIGRDIVLAAGGALFAFVLRGRLGPERWRPSRIGKYATFFTFITIGLALLHRITEMEVLRAYVGALGVMSAVTTVIAGIQYVAEGVSALRGSNREHLVAGNRSWQ